jgi:hypothetical protein
MGYETSIENLGLESAAERAKRNSTLIIAECLREDGTTVRLRVRNLSASGLKAECIAVADLAEDEPVRIRFRGLIPIGAKVVRVNGNELGFRFRNRVDVDRITRTIASPVPPEQSPRSEAVSNWIDHNDRQRQWHKLNKGIRGPRPI